MANPLPADTPQAADFRRQVLNPAKLRLFLMKQLPMAWLAGLRLTQLTTTQAAITVRFKFLTQNPFRSIYFACLAMAAELASGIQAMMHVQAGTPVSMLVTGLQGDFTKKAWAASPSPAPMARPLRGPWPTAAPPARAAPSPAPVPAWTRPATW